MEEVPRDVGFVLDRLAHGEILFAPVRESPRNGRKTFTRFKKVLRNYALS